MSSAHITVVVTGGSGFVGRHFVTEIRRSWPDVRVVVWDRARGLLDKNQEFLEVDLTDSASYLEALKELQPDWIVHLAAIAPIGEAAKDPELTQKVNVEATEVLLSETEEHSDETRFLVASSADIYGLSSDTPLPELPLDQAHPRNEYAESKLAMERFIEEKFNDRVVRVRPFTHIGPGQMKGFVTADFASQIADIEQGRQEREMLVGNLEAKRDFTDVRDVVRAYRLLMEHGKLGEVYHVASGEARSIQYLLEVLLSKSEAEIEVKQDPGRLRASEVSIVVGDASKLHSLTGWQPEIGIEDTLGEVLDWWRDYGATL